MIVKSTLSARSALFYVILVKTNQAVSTVILEVAEEQEQTLFEMLEKMPGVRVVNFSVEQLAK